MDKIKTHSIIYFLIIFGFCLSIIYLYSYWSSFDINVFEYVSIQQVVTVSIYPLFGTIVSFSIGYWYGALGDKKKTRTKPYDKFYLFLIAVLVIEALCLDFYSLWYSLTLILSIVLADIIIKKIPNDKFLINYSFTYFLIITILAFPLFAYTSGKINAKKIKVGDGVKYVETKYLNNIELSKNQGRLKYLGLNGDFYFFFE